MQDECVAKERAGSMDPRPSRVYQRSSFDVEHAKPNPKLGEQRTIRELKRYIHKVWLQIFVKTQTIFQFILETTQIYEIHIGCIYMYVHKSSPIYS